jgi:hypothetical protein
MSEETPATAPTGFVGRLLNFDRAVDGRRSKVLIGAAVVQAVLAPAIDRAIYTLRDSALLGEAAKDLGKLSFAGFSAVSLLSSTATLLLAAGVLGGRAAAFATSEDARGMGSLWSEARSVLRAEWAILTRKGMAEAMLIAGAATYIGLAATRDVLRIFRYTMWEGPVKWLGLEETGFAAPFVWLYKAENMIELGVFVAAVGALLGVLTWVLQAPRPPQASQIRSARIASSLPHLVDVQDGAAIGRVASSFHGDLVGRVMRSLGEWRAETPIESEADLHSRLRMHFISQGFAVASEVWVGRIGRVDLVLDDAVAVELKFGALRANERNRVMGQSAMYAGLWTGRGPVLIVCVDAPEARLAEVSQSAVTWNRALPDKEQDGELPAPIIVMTRVGAAGADAEDGST